jgi:glycosidase
MHASGVEWNTLLWGYTRRFEAIIPGQPDGTVVRYRLTGMTADGDEIPADENTLYAYYTADDPLPDWTREAVVYHIFVDRFSPGQGSSWQTPAELTGFYGGTLAGITESLDYFADLGVNVLYLSPIFPSPSHHGYDASDYFSIEPRFGSLDDFKRLLNQAHSREMRLILDFVPNHISNQHPIFQQAISDPNSPYRDWFVFQRWPDRYLSFFNVPDLPQLNLDHDAARQYILEATRYWLELGVDGYRIDYAIGPAPDFWADFRQVTRQTRPDCWTFGEVVDPPDAQLSFQGLLDGCLDFNLLEGLRQAFAFGRWDAVRLGEFLDRHQAYFPSDFSRPSFLDNHDMNRFLWAADGDLRRLKLAAMCQFTLSGPPLIYYGTEVGLSQERDVRQDGRGFPHEARLPMIWGQGQDLELRGYYRQLIALRRDLPSLRLGSRQTVLATPGCLVYSRSFDGNRVLVALNLSRETQSITIPNLDHLPALLLSSAQQIEIDLHERSVRIALPSLSGAILQ